VLVMHVSHMRKRETHDTRARLLFTLHVEKRYLTVYSPRRPPTPANRCPRTGTCEGHKLCGVGGLRGAQADRNL
jgi:hypothetical protein